MNLADVTVIAPSRNEVKNIPGFLASLPAAVQLILVDASSDETPALAAQVRQEGTLVERSQARIAEARNIGARLARTRWLVFTDVDVVFSPDYFSRLQSLRGGSAYYGPKYAEGAYEGYYRSFSRWQARLDRAGIPAVSGSNFIIERRAFEHAGGFDSRLLVNEDTELGYRLKRGGTPVAFRPELRVMAVDHRRLLKGATRKTLHTLLRCTLIYFNLFPALWRERDWGYWSA